MRWPRWYWELHAKAYLDLLLDLDSRPAPPVVNGADDDGAVDEGADSGGSGSPDPLGPRTPPGAGILPVGFAGRLNLTIPLATLLKLADRPGEIPGLGPVDPWLAWEPGPRLGKQSEDNLVPDRDRRGRPRDRARLRCAEPTSVPWPMP